MRLLAAAAALALVGCGVEAPKPWAKMRVVSSEQELRPTDVNSGQQFAFSAGEIVESYNSLDGGFKVHFTRSGKDAVLAGDADDSGVPDFVEQVAVVYDDVDRFYGGMGYRHPLSDQGQTDNGGDGRFDIYLVDFATNADGAFEIDNCVGAGNTCYGYVSQENDFAGYPYPTPVIGTITLGSHEYFHAIQSAYDESQGVVIQEGTAVLGEEQYDPTLDDFEGFIYGYLKQMDRPLDQPPPGPVPEFAYGSAIWWRYLTEKFDVATTRKLWEHCVVGAGYPSEPGDLAAPHWMVQQDAMLQTEYGSSFAQAFREFTVWNLFVGAAADASHYSNGAHYPLPLMTQAPTPYVSPKLLVFHASAQYFVTTPGAGMFGAQLASTDPAQTAGLDLLLAVRHAGKITATATSADVRAPTMLATAAGDDPIAIVVDAERSGGAYQPHLCLGAASDLAACAAANDPDGGVSDAGMPDAGQPDAGPVDAGIEPSLEIVPLTLGKATGCNAFGGAPLVFLLLLALRRLRG
ncbi:MAG: hypothetical protein QM723_39250 [Myxococcaceae bacterium]